MGQTLLHVLLSKTANYYAFLISSFRTSGANEAETKSLPQGAQRDGEHRGTVYGLDKETTKSSEWVGDVERIVNKKMRG
jgi:hypothetical protein